MSLTDLHQAQGAILAPDAIPLHYGDLLKEYQAGIEAAILLDRSHEGRLELHGKSRFELLNRMSTNKLVDLADNEGCGTLFLNAHARIIDRIEAYNRPDYLQIITEAGQGAAISKLLQKSIFFGDLATVQDISSSTRQFAIHGAQADAVLAAIASETSQVKAQHGIELSIAGATIYAMRRKPISGSHWALITPLESATEVYQALLELGQSAGLIPAGSLTYNTLRIRAGYPARPELNSNYIPLELGLWDEVHFAKGCYTGQEIIARMESRAKLAKTIVAIELAAFVQAPAEIHHAGQAIGTLTSSVQAPTGEIFAIGIIKTAYIEQGTSLEIGGQAARVNGLLGTQAHYI